MNERTRDWRRWVGGAAFVLAVVLLGTKTCASENASAEIHFRVGNAGGELRRLEAELFRPEADEVLGFYRGNFERGSGSDAGRWRLRAESGLYRLKVALVTSSGTVRVDRAVEIRDGAVVTLDLERDLAAR